MYPYQLWGGDELPGDVPGLLGGVVPGLLGPVGFDPLGLLGVPGVPGFDGLPGLPGMCWPELPGELEFPGLLG